MTKRILVVGANTGGIGDAFASMFFRMPGYEVMAPDINALNVEDPVSVGEYFASLAEPVDWIVYSAGLNKLNWIDDLDPVQFQRTMAVNATGLLFIAASQRSRWPVHHVRVAVVVSDASNHAMRGSVAYTASKAALANVVKSMGRELAPAWITVGVSPGVVEDTPMTHYITDAVPGFRSWTPEEASAYEKSNRGPLGRRITKDEVAETLVFALMGPAALNGSIITINGKGE